MENFQMGHLKMRTVKFSQEGFQDLRFLWLESSVLLK